MDHFDRMLKEKAKAEEFELPHSLETKMERILNTLPEKRTKRKAPLIAGVVAAALITTTTGTVVYGKNIPIVNTIIEYFKGSNTSLQYSGDIQPLEKYSTSVNKSITDNGIKITIDNVASDDNFLVLFYTVAGEGKKVFEFDDGMPPMVNNLHGDIMINGNKKPNSNNDSFMDAYLTDDGKVKGMIRADISGETIPDHFEVDFLVHNALGKDGNWDFNLNVSKKETMKDTKVVNVNKEAHVKYPDGREHHIEIEKVSLTPFGNQLVINEKVDSSVSISKADGPMPFHAFALFDDKGNALDVLNGQLGSGITGRNSFEFVKGNKDMKSLTLVPLYLYDDRNAKETSDFPVASIDHFPIEFKASDKGSILIEKIEYGDTETRIYYTKSGVVFMEGFFQFLDENGKNVFNKFEVVHKDYIIDRQKGTHVSVFPKLDKDQKYKLLYFPDAKFKMLNQYKVVIPLD